MNSFSDADVQAVAELLKIFPRAKEIKWDFLCIIYERMWQLVHNYVLLVNSI